MTCDTLFRCRETSHSDVLNQHTAPATKRNSRSEPGSWVTTGLALAFDISKVSADIAVRGAQM
jgi:hypothetical protein